MLENGKCKLCGMQAKLVKSHIIPEWAYQRMYGDENKMLRAASHHRAPIGYKRIGEWDRFLCDSCEAGLNTLDDYGRAVIHSEPGEQTFGLEIESADHGLNVLNVDYKRLKLFQISVLWKAGVCSRDFFAKIVLGEQEPLIRKMLIDKNPGDPSDYGCMMSAVRVKPDQMLHELIDRPIMYDEKGWKIARFLYAGCIWLYIVCQSANEFPLNSFFVRPGAPLPILPTELNDLPGLIDKLRWLGDQLNGRK